jgi:hypothetical protein
MPRTRLGARVATLLWESLAVVGRDDGRVGFSIA